MIVLILANVAAVALETVPTLWARFKPFFLWFEIASVAIFTVEYGVRVWASSEMDGDETSPAWRRRLSYMCSPLAIIDLLAILPSYLGAFVAVDLRALRIFRLLRLLKLVRYSPALASLGRVVHAERRALFAALIVMLGLLFTASTLMYLMENSAQPDKFASIPDALWWAIATLTTVGYGDVVPVTDAGKLVGGFVMIFGLAFYALPIGIIASGFSDEIHRREFIVPVRVIEDFPGFSTISREAARQLATRVRSLTMTPGTVISHRMDTENGLYCVISGEVSVFYHRRPIPLGAGDFLGEVGLISDKGRQPAAVVRQPARILWVESVDLHMLLSIFPEVGEQLMDYASERLLELVDEGYLAADARDEMLTTLEEELQH